MSDIDAHGNVLSFGKIINNSFRVSSEIPKFSKLFDVNFFLHMFRNNLCVKLFKDF